MLTVCDGCGEPLDRSCSPGDDARAIRMSDLGLCWKCSGSGSWGRWTEPGTEPKAAALEAVVVVAPFSKAFARFMERRPNVR